MGTPVLIKNCIVAWPELAEPHAAPGTDNPKYSVECIIDAKTPDGAAAMQALEAAFIAEVTAANKQQFAAQIPRPWHVGEALNAKRAAEGKDPRPELLDSGRYALRVSKKTKVPVVDAQRLDLDPTRVFGGCICNIAVDVYAWFRGVSPGVFCGLNGVQLVSDVNVTRLGTSGPTVEQMFEMVEGAPAPVQPTPVSDETLDWM